MILRRVLSIVLIITLTGQQTIAINFWPFRRTPRTAAEVIDCEEKLSPIIHPPEPLEERPDLAMVDAMRMLHDELPILLRERNLAGEPPAWAKIIENYLWPFLRSESKELTISIMGAANSGKSTLFNSLSSLYKYTASFGEGAATNFSAFRREPPIEVSEVQYTAGETARPVFIFSRNLMQQKSKLDMRFGLLEAWQKPADSTVAGPSIFYPADEFYSNLVFVDTPAFDVHFRRQVADEVFTWSDVIIYVFTGSNYKNDFNLEVMRTKFEELGPRPVILIYRVQPSISQAEAYRHFHEIAQHIYPGFPDDDVTRLPSLVLGTYLMSESENVARKLEPPEFISLNRSPEFPSLLADMDQRFESYRSHALEGALNYFLDGVADSLRTLQKVTEEGELTEQAFDLLLIQTVKNVVGTFPYYRISQEIDQVFQSRAQGLRNLARWIAYPMQSIRGRPTELRVDSAALRDLEVYTADVIDRTIKEFNLAARSGVMRIRHDNPNFEKYVNDVEEFRLAYQVPEGEPPYIRQVNAEESDVYISQHPLVQRRLNEYVERDWPAVGDRIIDDARSSFSQLTLQIQNEFTEIADELIRGQFVGKKALRSIYPFFSVAAGITAVSYIIFSDVNVWDIKAILSLALAHFVAKGLMHMDEKTTKNAWNEIINNWYGSRQGPRLIEILRRRLLPRTSNILSPNALYSIRRIQIAVEALSTRRLPLVRATEETIPRRKLMEDSEND